MAETDIDIEITPEMIEAGAVEVVDYDPECWGNTSEVIAKKVFEAMWKARNEA